MTIQTVTKVITSTTQLPPVMMRFFSDSTSAERYAADHGKVIYYVTTNNTFYVEVAA